jgi:hypothetical protein
MTRERSKFSTNVEVGGHVFAVAPDRIYVETGFERARRTYKLEGGEVESKAGIPLRRSADGHDPARLRGLPAIGRNVSGARRDADPVKALLAKEARGGLRR